MLQPHGGRQVQGRDVTPFVLSRLNELTGGESLRANLALVRNNALVGADIAVELARTTSGRAPEPLPPAPANHPPPLVVGGSIFDFVVRMREGEVHLNGGTHRGSLASSHGGVGRNVASALARLGAGPRLASAVGDDDQGRGLLAGDLDTSLVRVVKEARTAAYTAVLDAGGECKFGVGDMDIHSQISPDYLRGLEEEVAAAPLVVADGNLPQETLLTIMELCHRHKVPMFFEPTDLRKAALPLASPTPSAMAYCSPNLGELATMLATIPGTDPLPSINMENADDVAPLVAKAAAHLVDHYGLSVVMVTMSELGVLLVRRGGPEDPLPRSGRPAAPAGAPVSATWYRGAPCPPSEIVSVSGAGDCLAAGFIAAVLRGSDQAAAVGAGLEAARQSCRVSAAVPATLDVTWTRRAAGVRLL